MSEIHAPAQATSPLPPSVSPMRMDRVWNAVPVPLTPLLGRDEEIGCIRVLLDAQGTRLLTLTGPGGIGKTRLAIEVAAQVAPDFAHGACFVALASVRDPQFVVGAVAQALGLQDSGESPVQDIVAAVLRDRHLLLVLDNLEHVVGSVAPWLAALLAECPLLHVMVTSRIAVQIDGEQRFVVPPLPLLKVEAGEAVSDNAAVALFTQRARAANRDFDLTTGHAGVMAEICRQLEGLPLAIELAASRISVLSPPAILARLSDRLSVLKGDRRDAPERHRTMRDAIAWSYDLLPPGEQALFRRLAVFVGGFTVEAAEAVGGPMTLDLLTVLVDHSLVRRLPLPGEGARMGMHETIREFGLEQLIAHGEEGAARDAHAGYFLQMGAEADRGVRSHAQLEWFARLETDQDNLRAAIAWLAQQERIEEALKLATDIMWFHWIRGHDTESRDLLESLLAHPQAAKRTVGRVRALAYIHGTATPLGDPYRAKLAAMEAVSIAREHDDPYTTAFTLLGLGGAHTFEGDLDAATAEFEESLAISQERNDLWLIGIASAHLSQIATRRGDTELATVYAKHALQAGRDVGDRHLMAAGHGHLAEMALRQGSLERAEPSMIEALRLMRALGDKRNLPYYLVNLARIALHHGDVLTAVTQVEESFAITQQTGNRQELPFCLLALAHVTRRNGEHARATQLLRESILLSQQCGQVSGIAQALQELAAVAIESGDMRFAARMFGASDGLMASTHHAETELWTFVNEADLMAVVRSALGDAEFSTAFGAGQALTLDDAVREAMEFTPSQVSADASGLPSPTDSPFGLTPRELEVLRLMADGLTNQEIADTLFLSLRTVTSHVTGILTKLALTSRTAAVSYAIRHGLI